MRRTFALLSLALLLVSSVVSADNILPPKSSCDTPYAKSSLRIELRPWPMHDLNDMTKLQMEKLAYDNGVRARWIGVFSDDGPLYRSKYLASTRDEYQPDLENALKGWVKAAHKQGMPVITWFPLMAMGEPSRQHPEWLQKYFDQEPKGVIMDTYCCFNTGYGDAIINACNEAIDILGIDGLWFDGTVWTQLYQRPLPLSCRCDACGKLFKKDTGLELPSKVDWNDLTFKKWVAWRYESFSKYLGRLAKGIRSKHPNATVLVNHLHRPQLPWQCGIPLNPFPADIITASEAPLGEISADLTMRLCRAYGRPQSEVWKSIDDAFPVTPGHATVDPDPATAPVTDQLVHHALTCITAGGLPAFGGPHDLKVGYKAWKYIANALNPVRPYVSPDSVKYAAIHVSQQSETFYFSRDRKGMDWSIEPYWKSIGGWTQGLMAKHISPDYVFDKDFDLPHLSRYKVLILPLSIALSDAQCKAVVEFARRGGVVVLGPGAGTCDEWGEKRSKSALQESFGISPWQSRLPNWSREIEPDMKWHEDLVISKDEKTRYEFPGHHFWSGNFDHTWKHLYGFPSPGGVDTAVRIRDFGKGKVMASAFDVGASTWIWGMPIADGDTSIAVTDQTAYSGKKSLKFTDGPRARYDFCPDLETALPMTTSSDIRAGSLSFHIKLESGAVAHVDLRGSGKYGSSLSFGREGKVWSHEKALCDIPTGIWVGVKIDFNLDKKEYDVRLSVPKNSGVNINIPSSNNDLTGFSSSGDKLEYWVRNIPFANPDFAGFDRLVMVGEGTKRASFYLDDFELNIRQRSQRIVEPEWTLIKDNFELTSLGQVNPYGIASVLTDEIIKLAPVSVTVDAPDYIRVGFFRQGKSGMIVHLHNLNGSAIKPEKGTPAVLRLSIPVKSAKSVRTGKLLPVVKKGKEYIINVPPVVLHDVVVISGLRVGS